MGKEKTKNGLPNKSMHARIAFLQQAATYLTNQSPSRLHTQDNAVNSPATQEQETDEVNFDKSDRPTTISGDRIEPSSMLPTNLNPPPPPPPSARLVSHLTLIAQKSQIRLPPSTKHQICKRCSTLLVEGSTCRKFVENLSRGGTKAHAEVLVVECSLCGAKKRWPVGAKRQVRKDLRGALSSNIHQERTASRVAGESVEGGVEQDGFGE